jgi:hypothetical protein
MTSCLCCWHWQSLLLAAICERPELVLFDRPRLADPKEGDYVEPRVALQVQEVGV